MNTVLITWTAKREDTLNRIGQKYELYNGKLAIETKHDREFITEIIDSL